MSAPTDDALRALLEQVEREPWAHDFYALLRRIDAMRAPAPRLGESQRAQDDALRLGQDAELDFAAAPIGSFDAARDVPRLGVRFFGLFGPQGALPLHLTELARERERNAADPTLARFADVFHHRMLSLFHRAWAQGQPTADLDRPAQAAFPRWLGAIAGVAPGIAPGSDSTGAIARARHSGLLARGVRSAEAIELVLAAQFGWRARVVPYTGHWLRLRDADRTRLGPEGLGQRLGQGAIAGRKVWDRQYRFTIEIGPMTLAQYEALLPPTSGAAASPADGAPTLVAVRDWVRQALGRDLGWALRPKVAAAEVPAARLGRHARLGYTSWLLGKRRSPSDRADLRIEPERLHAAAPHATGAAS